MENFAAMEATRYQLVPSIFDMSHYCIEYSFTRVTKAKGDQVLKYTSKPGWEPWAFEPPKDIGFHGKLVSRTRLAFTFVILLL